jgi:hypothetical protein
MVEADGAQFGKAAFTQSITFQAYGTNIRLRWRGDVILGVNINGETSAVGTQCLPLATLSDWHESCLKQSLTPQTYTVTIAPFPEQPFFFDSIMVMDRTVENLFPLVAGVAIAIFMTLAVIISALWERRR